MTVDHYRYWLEQTAQGGFRAHFPDLADFQVEAHTLARLFPMLTMALWATLKSISRVQRT